MGSQEVRHDLVTKPSPQRDKQALVPGSLIRRVVWLEDPMYGSTKGNRIVVNPGPPCFPQRSKHILYGNNFRSYAAVKETSGYLKYFM